MTTLSGMIFTNVKRRFLTAVLMVSYGFSINLNPFRSAPGYSYRSNCELSNREGFELDTYDFDNDNDWDFYGRERLGGGCLDGKCVLNLGFVLNQKV